MFYVNIITTIPTLVTGYNIPDLYYLKMLRIFELKASQNITNGLINKLKGVGDIKKQTIKKIEFFCSLLIFLFLIIHIISCIWLKIGHLVEGSWILADGDNKGLGDDATPSTKYITSFYWVVTTLTTVGYGDFKGFTTEEYIFTMLVEFCGILFFSIMMGSINEIFLDGGDSDAF